LKSEKKQLIRRCNELALRAEGRTGTNPLVGSILTCDGKIVAEDWHRGFGLPHAEANVIHQIQDFDISDECEMYVSLEPCNHQGKTPPCTTSIIQKKIPAVIIDQIDPNEKMAGKSLDYLRDNHVSVTDPLNTATGARILAPFHINIKQKRPYIIIKMAVSRDGFIGRPGGQIKISHPISDRWVHKIRSRVQGIMVGTTTASNDNPSLTARYNHRNHPVRIIPDRQGILSRDLKIFQPGAPTIVFTSSDQTYPHAKVIRLEDMSLPVLFRKLYDLHIGSILIEGGARLVTSLMENDLWDEWILIQSQTVSLRTGITAPTLPRQASEYEKNLGTDVWKIMKNSSYR